MTTAGDEPRYRGRLISNSPLTGEGAAEEIRELVFEGKREEAFGVVPDQFADEISLVGPKERIRERLEAWRETPVTTLIIGQLDVETLRTMAELID